MNDIQKRWDSWVELAKYHFEMGANLPIDDAFIWANERITELEKAHVRYEAVRKLNPVQFAKLYRKNIDSGEAFDSLVDRIASGELVL
jgi:hypothetical protein